MLRIRHEFEQIHHVHEPDLDVGQVLAEEGGGGQGLRRRTVAATRHNDVRFGALIVACPGPDAGAFRAMLDRRFNVKVLEMNRVRFKAMRGRSGPD
jgi:hypothetical protein